ncbi:dynein heavy chain [Entomophthora muscae]|uniref:Dynein heavy chain n=1 Tax=Entomophthora muscae TaxID=34485 RepID=A0ACC2SYR0_9FUNG|nr:dynein heavy chain [Entomophthora muscae]
MTGLTMIEKEMKVSWRCSSPKLPFSCTIYLGSDSDSTAFLSWIKRSLPSLLFYLPGSMRLRPSKRHWRRFEGTRPFPTSLPLWSNVASLLLADAVLTDLEVTQRCKCEHLITELVHQRDVIRLLIKHRVSSSKDFKWLIRCALLQPLLLLIH